MLKKCYSWALLLASRNPALKRLAVTVTHVKPRIRAVLVPGRVKDRSSTLPDVVSAIDTPLPVSSRPDDTSVTTSDKRRSSVGHLRAPVEAVSPSGTFRDRTTRVVVTEQHPLTREQVLQEGQNGTSTWLLEARRYPRLLELMLAECDAMENHDSSL